MIFVHYPRRAWIFLNVDQLAIVANGKAVCCQIKTWKRDGLPDTNAISVAPIGSCDVNFFGSDVHDIGDEGLIKLYESAFVFEIDTEIVRLHLDDIRKEMSSYAPGEFTEIADVCVPGFGAVILCVTPDIDAMGIDILSSDPMISSRLDCPGLGRFLESN